MTSRNLFALILFLILGLGHYGQGFKQELFLYLKSGNHLYFENNVPDLSTYNQLIPQIISHCTRGMWFFYEGVNYKKVLYGLGHPYKSDLDCYSFKYRNVSSLRHLTINDTSIASISLYNETAFGGEETLVTDERYPRFKTPIRSFSFTGTVGWTLYEGKDFTGKSVCVEAESKRFIHWRDNLDSLSITTIGSVVKGCVVDSVSDSMNNNFKIKNIIF